VKNVIIGEPRPEPLRQSKEIPVKKSPESSSKSSTLGGQEQKKGAKSVKTGLTSPTRSPVLGGHEQQKNTKSAQTGLTGCGTGLTGPSGSTVKNFKRSKKKERPSFKELLTKYEEKGAT